ncbi:hypothetical protein BDR06DRAFT_1011704 [Suillus hirtellus]|nr:hypothetical protein BDR06DRAFT_1011704 [Suillus hirtellus]
MDTRGLSRHCASCLLYKKSSLLATKKRQECAKEVTFANFAAVDLPVNTSNPHTIGHPRPIASRQSPGRQQGGSAALTFNPTSPVTSQRPLYILQNDSDVEMDINCGDETELDVLGTRPMRQIPRPFNDIEPLEEDLNYPNNADVQIPSTQNSAALLTQSRI